MFVNPSPLLPLLSLGLGYAQSNLIDTSALETPISSFEVFAQTYTNTPITNLFLRPGIRFSYEPESSEEMPSSLSIRERTLKSAAELSVLFNGVLVPTLTLQGAILSRTLTLHRQAPVVSSGTNDLTRRETLGQFAIAASLGIPIAQGSIMIEPFYRLLRIHRDDRQSTQWGCDFSYVLPATEDRKVTNEREMVHR